MNKKFLSAILFGALAVASTGSFVSCKDYDDDINNLQTQIGQLANKQDLQSQVSTLQSAISTAQSAAENKAAAAQKAADEAKAAVEAAAAKAAAATTEAEKAAADAAAAKAAADAAASAADLKAAEEAIAALKTSLEEVEALAATLVKTEDFDAAKQELNEKYAALEAKMKDVTGTTGMTGLQVLSGNIAAAYGIWGGVQSNDSKETAWNGPKKEEIAGLVKGQYTSAVGTKNVQVAVNPTNITDLSKTTFAVVNKYGDVAPLALSNAKPLTRANDANTYTLDIKSAIKDASTIKTFHENFASADNGNVATLKAGLVTASFVEDFVTFDKTKNADYATFAATVKYGDYSGSVELEAVEKAQFVYAAYILNLDESVLEHDSLLWNLNYDGDLVLTYDADAVKTIMADAKEDKKFDVVVKQINPNGYIHNTTATITFKAKEDEAVVVEKEVNLSTVTHTVSVLKVDKDGNPQQYETISKDAILEKLGYKKGSADSIHFAHSQITGVKILDAYLGATGDGEVDKLPVANGKFTFAEMTYTKDDFTFNFAEDYAKANFTTANKVDVAQNKTVNVVLKVTTVDDKDLDGKVTTEYTVTLPLKFEFPKYKEMFTWNPKADFTSDAIDKGIKSAVVIKKDAPLEYVDGKFTKVYKKDANGNNTTEVDYYKPSLTAELNYSTNKKYLEKLAAIEEHQVDEDYTIDDKTAEKAALIEEYKGYVTTNGTKYVAKTATAAGYWKESSTPASEANINYIVLPQSSDTKIGKTYSYTIKGIKGKILGREVSLGDQTVNVVDPNEPVYNPIEISVAKLNKDVTDLYNALYTPKADTNFDGSFTLKNEDGKVLDLESNGFSYAFYEIVDGEVSEDSESGFTVTVKAYNDNLTTPQSRNGLQITVPATATGKKYQLVITANTKVANIGTVYNGLKFKINVEVK